MKVALTGTTGMIGRHMKALLDSESIDCICVDRSAWDLECWKELEELDGLFLGSDVIFHFGAFLPKSQNDLPRTNSQTQKLFDANVRSCLNLAEWAVQRGKPLVFLSGSTVYKNTNAKCINEEAQKVVNGFGGFYGYSKLLAEHVLEHFVEDGLRVINLRPSSVYGAGLGRDKFIQQMLLKAKNSGKIEIQNSMNKINLVHAFDVASAALSAFKNNAWGTYNIAAKKSVSIEEVARGCLELYGSNGELVNTPTSDEPSTIRFDLDCNKAFKAFDFSPKVELSDGLKMMQKGELLFC